MANNTIQTRLSTLRRNKSLSEDYRFEISELLEHLEHFEPMDIAYFLNSIDSTNPLPPAILRLIWSILEAEAAEGNPDAHCMIGAFYYTGRGGEQDFAKAVEHYAIAAEGGNEEAIENLGYCYYYGRSMPVDYEKAFHCFVKGALTGRLNSLYKLGDMYRYGYFVEKDETTASRLYIRCCRKMRGEDKRMIGGSVYHRMGDLYAQGIGVIADPVTALSYYQKAERWYVIMIEGGDRLVIGRMNEAIQLQSEMRKQIQETLPAGGWVEKQNDEPDSAL